MNLLENREFAVSIENIIFRLLVDRRYDEPFADSEPFDLHRHVSAELFACVSGEMELAVGGGRITLNSGDLALVPPGVPHCKLPHGDGSIIAVLSFICEPRAERGTHDLYGELSRCICSNRISVCRGCPDLCAEADRIVSMGQSDSGILTAMKGVELLMGIADTFSETSVPIQKAKSSEGKYDIQRMMRLDGIIASSYMKELTLKDIADSLYISARQLDRIVRRRYGKSLHAVIMETRVKAAAHMLLTTGMTVGEIGIAVGFSSGAGFYREFSKYYGVTPAEFRKKQQYDKSLLKK